MSALNVPAKLLILTTLFAFGSAQGLSNTGCTFDDNDFCGWNPAAGEWTWRLSQKALTGTANAVGPVADQDQNGYFAFLSTGNFARLQSPVITTDSVADHNLSFWYFFNGASAKSLTVLFSNNTISELNAVWAFEGQPLKEWRKAEVVVRIISGCVIAIDARKGTLSPTGVVAVDDITLQKK